MDDKKLIKKILKGSVDDYALFIERYQVKLQSSLSFYCQNRQEIEYYLHETFTRAYSKLHKFDSDFPVFPWLKQISMNLLRDELRSRKRRADRVDIYLSGELNKEEINDFRQGRLEALQSCIAELDNSPRELIRNYYWKKKSIADLAKLSERKPSAVKMQLMRLRELLKECVKHKSEAPNGF